MAENRVKNEAPELYEAISPFVPYLPDLRSKAALERMRKMGATITDQDNWRVIENEIEAASREGGEEDLTLIQAIFAGDLETLEAFLKDDLDDFFITYPALIWLASRVAPEETIIPLFVSQNQKKLLPLSFDVANAIPWIKNREMAKYLHEIDPNAIEVNDKLFVEWTKRGELGKVLWGLEDGRVDPARWENEAVIAATIFGHVDIVKELMKDKRVNASDHQNAAIKWTAHKGHGEIARELLKDERVDPSVHDDYTIKKAAEKGHINVLIELLKDMKIREKEGLHAKGIVDPSAGQNQPIIIAAEKGRVDIVRELMKNERVDPSARMNQAIKRAAYNGHIHVVRELLKDERVVQKLKTDESTKKTLRDLGITIA